MPRANPAIACAAFLAIVFASPATGQINKDTRTRNGGVRQTAFDRTAIQTSEHAVTFGRQAPRIGDRVEQAMSLEMRLTTSMRQGNQLLEKSRTTMRNQQRRIVTTTGVDQGLINAVEVRYLEATKQLDTADIAPDVQASPAAVQPVQGKTYRCRREGGPNGKLIVADSAGNVPPANEHEIVAQNMEMVGRSNPLAEFLAGRTVAVGETAELPEDIARRLFSLGKKYGEVTRFDLTLEKTQADDQPACAVFLARIEAASSDSSQMRLEVQGPLVVETATCRAVRTSFTGPIGLSETRGSYSTAHQLIGTGQLKMSVASDYRDALR